MDTSLDPIRAKIAELEAKLADLRIERELVALRTGTGAEINRSTHSVKASPLRRKR
jgi:hypothetical protein